MTPARALVIEAACARLGIDRSTIEPLGGATGTVFATPRGVLKLGRHDEVEREVIASTAARGAVPVARVLDRCELDETAAILMERMPGETAWSPQLNDAARARRRGRACGLIQRQVGEIAGPAGLPTVTAGGRLLHLDLHPLNILLNERDEVTAVLDWANAAVGSHDWDRARTASILRRDPAVRELAGNPSWAAFVEGWSVAAELDMIIDAARVWADEFLDDDLARRAEAASGPHSSPARN